MHDHDYVIVGAGSAGCVLAARLSEDPRVSVLLLEAGPPDTRREIHVPAAFPTLFRGPLDWAYETAAQPELGGRRLFWPRGRVVGGSSSLNAMVYIRGQARDYDTWAARGNEGWGFRDVLTYFKRAERQTRGESEFHGADGPLSVSELRTVNPLTRAFLAACREQGLPRNDDFNGARQEGVGLYQVTQKGGQRHSNADAYLKPALKRPNLTVLTGVQATEVLLDGRRAVGVAYLRDGQPARVHARREVLLCGGAINSPHLLLLSGIGAPDHLREVGLPVRVALPGVGRNLQDHLLAAVEYACTRPVSLAGARSPLSLLRYLLLGRGPLTSNISEAGGFVRVAPDAVTPDVQLKFAPTWFMNHGADNPPGHGFTVGVTVLRPGSRGSISLRSADPHAPPVIQPQYLSAEADLPLFVGALKLARRLAGSAALAPYRGAEVWPGPDAREDDDLARHVRETAQTLYHPVGTCRMGEGPLAVVDPRLRVVGVAGLRVVDASVMPTLVSGNTNAAVTMIAEKAADLIREDAALGTSRARAREKASVLA